MGHSQSSSTQEDATANGKKRPRNDEAVESDNESSEAAEEEADRESVDRDLVPPPPPTPPKSNEVMRRAHVSVSVPMPVFSVGSGGSGSGGGRRRRDSRARKRAKTRATVDLRVDLFRDAWDVQGVMRDVLQTANQLEQMVEEAARELPDENNAVPLPPLQASKLPPAKRSRVTSTRAA